MLFNGRIGAAIDELVAGNVDDIGRDHDGDAADFLASVADWQGRDGLTSEAIAQIAGFVTVPHPRSRVARAIWAAYATRFRAVHGV